MVTQAQAYWLNRQRRRKRQDASWRPVTLTAAQLLLSVGYSSGESGEAGGSISGEPNRAHRLQIMVQEDGIGIIVRLSGNAVSILAGRELQVDGTAYPQSLIGYDADDDRTDLVYDPGEDTVFEDGVSYSISL